MTVGRRDRLLVFGIALAARLLVVGWAATKIPPAADGTYYHLLATRLAAGQGYTWLWPDGVVTYAAHYPVGYPALLAIPYALFGAKPLLGMLLNALLGAASALATLAVLDGSTPRRWALAGALAVGLHPALVPYTAAFMTEGATASLLTIAAALASRGRQAVRSLPWLTAAGLVMGVATLVRPQSLLLAPLFGLLAAPSVTPIGRRVLGGATVAALALVVCLPWTARNCARMERCALVSVNGGWNLAIGTQTTDGAWAPIDVPEPCRTVFQEAAKDACFGREALAEIRAHPLAWLARAPRKLRATFDYLGAAPWYLHAANPAAFPERAKHALGAFETLVVRLLLAAALVTTMRLPGGARRARRVVGVLGLVACVIIPGALAYLACAIGLVLVGPRALTRAPVVVPVTAAVVLATALTHAVFFGSGRYGLVVVPFVTALAFVRPQRDPLQEAA